MSDRTEQDLVDEIAALTRLVADQERAVAEATDEVRRTHATLSWRLHVRFEKATDWLLSNRLLREPYRAVRRAIEIWVEHGFLYIFKFGIRKIGHAQRGRSLVVEDHFAPPDLDAYQKWLKVHTPTAEAYAQMRAAKTTLREAPVVPRGGAPRGDRIGSTRMARCPGIPPCICSTSPPCSPFSPPLRCW